MAVSLSIEFIAHYEEGVLRDILCGGADGCGAVVGDREQHVKWHERMFPYDVPLERTLDGQPVFPQPGPTITGK